MGKQGYKVVVSEKNTACYLIAVSNNSYSIYLIELPTDNPAFTIPTSGVNSLPIFVTVIPKDISFSADFFSDDLTVYSCMNGSFNFGFNLDKASSSALIKTAPTADEEYVLLLSADQDTITKYLRTNEQNLKINTEVVGIWNSMFMNSETNMFLSSSSISDFLKQYAKGFVDYYITQEASSFVKQTIDAREINCKIGTVSADLLQVVYRRLGGLDNTPIGNLDFEKLSNLDYMEVT